MKQVAVALLAVIAMIGNLEKFDAAAGYTHVPQRPFIDCKHWQNHKGIPVCVGDR